MFLNKKEPVDCPCLDCLTMLVQVCDNCTRGQLSLIVVKCITAQFSYTVLCYVISKDYVDIITLVDYFQYGY